VIAWIRAKVRWWTLNPATKELVRETDRINQVTRRLIAEHYERYPREN
jgi:hypothetical protein